MKWPGWPGTGIAAQCGLLAWASVTTANWPAIIAAMTMAAATPFEKM